MNAEAIFYNRLDRFLAIQQENHRLLKMENDAISIDAKCEGGSIFSELSFGILLHGEIEIFWDAKPEFWKGCDPEQSTDLFTPELETEVKSMIRKYLDREVSEGVEEDMADLICSQKMEAKRFKD